MYICIKHYNQKMYYFYVCVEVKIFMKFLWKLKNIYEIKTMDKKINIIIY